MSVGSLIVIAGLLAGSLPAAGQTKSGASLPAIFSTYCSTCHDGGMRSPSGNLLDPFEPTRINEKPEVWARAYRHLQAGTMPPFGAPRPDRATYDAASASIERAWNLAPKTEPATSQEIAERLAALLWNTAPDASLLQDAKRNRLNEPAVLERQINRMLADPRTQAFVARFFFPWLGLDKLRNSDPDKTFFPDYEVSLRDAFAKETELFLLSQLRDDRDPVELWSAKYTFLNEQLAHHYKIPNVKGTHFRMVTLSTPQRWGLLGHGSILVVTSRHQHGSDAAYTSPASRSTWVLRHFLGVPPPNPFPNAQPVKPEMPITPQTRTLPVQPCMTCHQNFFPLGYALENFDPVGAWRTHDQAGPVDASGKFVDGSPIDGVVALRNVLLQRPEAFRTTITENLLIYAAGKQLGSSRPTADTLVSARQILNGMSKARWSKIIAAMVREKIEKF